MVLPVIVIQNRRDQISPLGVLRDWQGQCPEGWDQVGYVEDNGVRHINWDLPNEH